jgi:uncharacterized protein (TIGR03437 family)
MAVVSVSASEPERASTPLDKLPMRFEANRGQAGGEVQFVGVGQGLCLELSPTRNTLRFFGMDGKPRSIRTRFVKANPNARAIGETMLVTSTNYFHGNSPKQWITNVPSFERVHYHGVYRGIDLVFHARGQSLEYDLVVEPGADARQIQLIVEGVDRLEIRSSGDLVATASGREVRWNKPVVYQMDQGARHLIAGGFVQIAPRRVGFRVGPYDHTRELVIDPTISFQTYFGGNGDDYPRGIARDSAGNIYIAGFTESTNLPVTKGAFQTSFAGGTMNYINGDAFIAKLNPNGTSAIYVTYLGGSQDDIGTGLAVDSNGSVYITGYTTSSDFPTKGGVSDKFAGAGGNPFLPGGDAFVSKLSPDGSALVYSTYLGGSMDDRGLAIAVDSAGEAYVAGSTMSANFPLGPGKSYTPGGYQGAGGSPPLCSGCGPALSWGDAFVVKLDSAGANILGGMMLGGTLDDVALSIALDPTGGVYIGGLTLSSNFPTKNAFQSAYGGANPNNEVILQFGDAFLARLDPTLQNLMFSTYFGGSGDDAIWGLTTDSSGNVYATGLTTSANFPVTPGSYSTIYSGPSNIGNRIFMLGDAFVAKFNSSGERMFATYLGGSDDDMGWSIALDSGGNIFVAGLTCSADFSVPGAIISKFAGTAGGDDPISHGFLAELSPDGAKLEFATYLGGSQTDSAVAITTDSQGNVYVAGGTYSTDLMTTPGVIQSSYGGGMNFGNFFVLFVVGDGFITKISGFPAATPALAAVVNGASFAGGGVVPGEIATAFGSNLTSSTGINLTSSLPLPNLFLTDSLIVNNQPVPLFAVDNVSGQQQINFQVPWETASAPNAMIAVSSNGTAGSSISVPVLPAQPGIFNYSAGGKTFGAILHANFALANTANPAKPGEIVLIYCTGLGAVASPPEDGTAGNGEVTMNTPVVMIGGTKADVSFSGLAPGFVGLYQVNAAVPSGAASGNQAVTVEMLGASSNSVLLPVQ